MFYSSLLCIKVSLYLFLIGLSNLIHVSVVSAEDRGWIGLSAFGIQSKNFQGQVCKNFLKAALKSPTPSIAVLYKTFGNNKRCLRRFWKRSADLGKPQLTQFHFSNEAGRRTGTLDRMDFYHQLDISRYNKRLERMPDSLRKSIIERVREIKELINDYSWGGKFILSTGLEDNYTAKAFENLYEVIASEWPYAIARNMAFTRPMRKQTWQIPDDLMLEFHGYTRKIQTNAACIANGDGQDVDFLPSAGIHFRDMKAASHEQVISWIARAREKQCVTFLWAAKWQGFFSTNRPPLPLSRTFRFDKQDIKIITRIFKESGF